MKNPRIVLNELKWKKDFNLDLAEIWYLYRGAPNDAKIITGKDIIKLEKSFMHTTSAMIPYHRIFKIVYQEKVVYQR